MLKVSLGFLYVNRKFTGPLAFYMVCIFTRTVLPARDGTPLDTKLSILANHTTTRGFKPLKPSGHFMYHQV
jgi:hypothetical protein